MPIFGYLGILGLFAGLIVICFFWGIWEYKKPKDPGPLFIDLDRTIKKRLRTRESDTSMAPIWGTASNSRQAPMIGESNGLPKNTSVNETIRVRGNVRIGKGEVIPFNMIIEGNLVSQEDVTFQGGIHVKGRATIGANNRLEKSIVCQKDLFLCQDVIVNNCIDCEGFVFIKNGVRVGVGIEGGGIASKRTIYLENAEGPLRIQSQEGIRLVGNLEDVFPKDMKCVEVENK
jgi:hypothetical protein